ncbi:MAG TPA: hypothetical protein VEK38_01325 [Candidatus Bathyarchaeia archaeon]|nr:hypothetical protein [Candidatus Bathyarchaeia archaeon]
MLYHFLCLFLLLTPSHTFSYMRSTKEPSSAVTYQLNGGRFGDNLLSYTRAKWISYREKIPLALVPFKYSKKLVLHTHEQKIDPSSFARTEEITKDTIIDPYSNTLYISTWKSPLRPQWNNKTFLSHMRALIAPIDPISTLNIAHNTVSVAVHVRTGGDYDPTTLKKRKPHQFPPITFYTHLMQLIITLYPHQNIYFHIFTDDSNPEKFIHIFRKKFTDPRISFGYRKEGNNYHSNVLDDFFAMMDFDCLIRPASHFSLLVEHLGRHELILKPAYTYHAGKQGHIDNIILLKKTENGWEKKLLPPT